VLENRRGVMERKRKLVRQYQLDSSSRPCVGPPLARPMLHPTPLQFQPRPQLAGQGFSTPQCQVILVANNFQTPTAGSQNVQRTQAAQTQTPMTEPPREGVPRHDQLEQFSAQREHNQHTKVQYHILKFK
jgi:hypothetical protein